MAKSKSSRKPDHVRQFYRAGLQRFEEAQFLFTRSPYTTATVYLAGYAVECMLKALLLFQEPVARHASTLDLFRGARAHDFDWLKEQLCQRLPRSRPKGKASLSPDIAEQLAKVNWWSTDLRYHTGALPRQDTEAFLGAAEKILVWVKGRLGYG
jgi:HEPN domain-containing protein